MCMKKNHSKEKLEAFFKQIAFLTSTHDSCKDNAVVTAKNLGEALEKVDPDWWKNIPPAKEEPKEL